MKRKEESIESGAFKVAFWVMAVIVTVFMAGIVSAIVTNDRTYTAKIDEIDQRRISSESTIKSDLNRFEIEVISRLAKIETMLATKK